MKNKPSITIKFFCRVFLLLYTPLFFYSFQSDATVETNSENIMTIIALAVAVFTAVYVGYKKVFGIEKDIKAYLGSAEVKALIKEKVDNYIVEREASENAISHHQFYVVSATDKKSKDIHNFLKSQGFSKHICTTTNLQEKPKTGEIIVFNDLSTPEIERIAAENGTAHFIYYNTENERWNGSVPMKSFANIPSTLKDRLLQSLKTNV